MILMVVQKVVQYLLTHQIAQLILLIKLFFQKPSLLVILLEQKEKLMGVLFALGEIHYSKTVYL